MPYDKCAGYEGFECPVVKTGKQQQKPRCRSCANTLRSSGKTHSPETRAKISVAKLGNTCAAGNKGKIRSQEARQAMSLARGGDGDLENRRYPGLAQWTRAVKNTFPCCVICRSTEALEAHHIAPKAMYPELATFPLNGLTLCYDCHRGTNGVHNKREV